MRNWLIGCFAVLAILVVSVREPLAIVYFTCAISVVSGTIYWFRSGRRASNPEGELFVLIGLYVLFVFLTVLIGGVAWIVSSSVGNLNSSEGIAHNTRILIAFREASTNFFAMTGRWPNSISEVNTNAMAASPTFPPPLDAWGHSIVYEPYAATAGYGRVVSYGRDGKPGGVGPEADIEIRFP